MKTDYGLIDKSEEDVKSKSQEMLDNRELSDIRFILKSCEGRRFLWKVMAAAGVFRTSFRGGSSDQTAFNEGKRSIGLDILNSLIEANPKSFTQMQEEYQSDLERRKRKEKEIIEKKTSGLI